MADKRYRFFASSLPALSGHNTIESRASLEEDFDRWVRDLPAEYVVPSDSIRVAISEDESFRVTVSLTAVAHHAEARAAVWAAEVQGLLAKQELLRQVSGGVQAAPPGSIIR